MKKIFILIFLSIGLLRVTQTLAQKPSVAVSIYPPILAINADPPAEAEAKIYLQNNSDKKLVLDISYRTLQQRRLSSGQIEFKEENKLEPQDVLIRSKIKIFKDDQQVSSIEIDPNEELIVTLKANIDNDLPQGDYYFSVIFITPPTGPDLIRAQSESTSNIQGGIGTNVLLSVGKKEPAGGYIREFSSPLIVNQGPIPFTLLIENSSDHYINPQGKITITDMFGNSVGQIDIFPQYILAHSSRYLKDEKGLTNKHNFISWPEKFLFGMYSAKLVVNLSEKGPTFVTSTSFISIPIIILFAFFLAAFILTGIYIRVRTKMSPKRHTGTQGPKKGD